MKKSFQTLLCTLLIFALLPSTIYAADIEANSLVSLPNTYAEILYEDNFIIESSTIIYPPHINTLVSSKSISSSRIYTIKDSSGSNIATFTLSASFKYDGTTSKCTSVSHSTSVSNNGWSFSSASSSKNGAQATGTFTLKKSFSLQSISQSISLTCDKNGKIH